MTLPTDLDLPWPLAAVVLVALGWALWRSRRSDRERDRLQADTALQGEALQAMFDASPVAMMFSSGRHVRYTNPAFQRLLGYAAGDEAPDFYVDAAVRDAVRAQLARGEGVPEHEVRVRSKDGQLRTCRSTLVPWTLHGERGVMGWAVDITELKQQEDELRDALNQARAANARLVDFTDVSAERFWETDAEFRMTGFWMRGGVSEAIVRERMGRRLWDVLTPTTEFERTQMARFRAMLDARETFVNFEYHQLSAEGQPEWISLSGKPMFDEVGHFLGYRGCTINIDERKRREAALEQARHEAQEANRAKSMFLATMSHEIRTPMNGIVGMTALALEADLPGQPREYLNVVQQSSQALLAIINDILDLSKIEAGQMELERAPLQLRELMDGTLKTLAFTAQGKGVTLQSELAADVPLRLVGDPTRLRQVLLNLLGNAVKFTPHGGTVTLRVLRESGGEAQGEADAGDAAVWLRFEVEDTGIGIPADKLEAIFEPFSQADSSTTRKYGGTGLGLTICRRLVELMGGRIGVRSTEGAGSTFHFNAPMRQASQQQVAAQARAQMPLRALNILLVEDHPINQMLAVRMLERGGHRVTVAGSGLEGVQRWRELRPDVVLMDLQMPVMDGLEATRRIREAEASEQLPRTPIIAMTANAFAEDRQACLAAGMDAYLSKPAKAEALYAALSDVTSAR
ncbi:MAG: ATP-binding protein [Burkholderiaceae bacterium]